MRVISLSLDNSSLDKKSVLANRLIEYGNLVEKYDVITPSLKDEKNELSDKVECYGIGGGNKLIQFIKIYNLAKKLLREEKYDIITAQDQSYLALTGLLLSKKFKVGLEIQVHGFEKCHGLRKSIAKYILPRANAVRCVSQRLKKQLIDNFGVKEEKITVVPIFSEASGNKLSASGGEVGSKAKNKFVFLTVGRLVPVKNIGWQIEAIREVIKQHPRAELWIAGEGSERKRLKLEIENWKLEDKVKLLGWQSGLGKYFSQADAFVLTSDSEGWGLAVIEAAAAGLPIIMTDVGCAGEVIKDGESGLVISVGDRQKLIEAMLKLVENSELRARLGESAKLAVKQLPTKERTLALYKESWEKALAEKIIK